MYPSTPRNRCFLTLALTCLGVPGPALVRAEGPDHPDRKANRLIHASSPYLLQHAHIPVAWYEWSAEAFARAK